MDTDKRSADLIIRLKHDGLTKTKFFRTLLTGYLEGDPDIVRFISKHRAPHQSKNHSKIIEKSASEASNTQQKYGLEEGDIENIFDILEKQHPDL